ncbi:hypothetical protein M431DRAFT_225647 [Trichoderma harzianum CBS 226.95]|uniref:Uncharacterized protein n=1 Tax=Trichoderma harzianum CBS 226.95 TaxID=983964 RepID=A0A2T4A3Q3_TRIHA|nr:hypothetical protein M431DRAFT_225647 [Trichoderma harzianum CBS 226.95]PTB51705.1 hypothetical protein M431DRAFT_225647 [Trichoderma harzianum CBS 226.95]
MQPRPWNYPPEGPKPCRFSGSIPQAAGLSVRKITTHMPATERKPRDQKGQLASPSNRPSHSYGARSTRTLRRSPTRPVAIHPLGYRFEASLDFCDVMVSSLEKKAMGPKGRGDSWAAEPPMAFEWVSVALGWPPGSFSFWLAASHSKRGHH